MRGMRLNIGAGQTYIPGFVNIDIDAKAELQLDLSSDALPFPDSSVDLIFTYHTLEHVPDHLHALAEMHRVLRHDGTLLLGLPYVTLTEFNLVNPYHLHNFSEYSFDFFDPKRLKGSAEEPNEILFRRVWQRFHYLGRINRHLTPEPLRRWQRRHLFNVVKQFDIGVVAIKQRDREVDAGPGRSEQMRTLFDECLNGRRPYRQPDEPKTLS